MKNYRLSKGVTERYTSFEELAKAYGCKPVIKQTKDKNKLEKQRVDFGNKHLCPNCKQPMSYIDGTNILACRNEKCKGVKFEMISDEETKVSYSPAYHLLDEHGAEIAANIFAEY